jgi:AraC-like DNA-binding protein
MGHGQYFRFDDPDHFQRAISGADCEVLTRSKGKFDVELTLVDLDRLWLKRFRNGSYIMHSTIKPGRAPVFFLADARQPPVRHNGRELSPEEIVVFCRGADNHTWLENGNSVATISLTPEDLAAAGQAIAGRELSAPAECRTIRPAPALMARLRSLHKSACQLAKNKPRALAHRATATSLEQQLEHALVACLAETPAKASGSPAGCHSQIIARFEEFLAARRYEPVYLGEICGAVGVSERTLRTCCHEHLGIGPIHYLWLRRMHLARRALLGAGCTVKSVTEIATTFGFWELGRFSVEYRKLFGELPSATLKRPSVEASGAKAH